MIKKLIITYRKRFPQQPFKQSGIPLNNLNRIQVRKIFTGGEIHGV